MIGWSILFWLSGSSITVSNLFCVHLAQKGHHQTMMPFHPQLPSTLSISFSYSHTEIADCIDPGINFLYNMTETSTGLFMDCRFLLQDKSEPAHFFGKEAKFPFIPHAYFFLRPSYMPMCVLDGLPQCRNLWVKKSCLIHSCLLQTESPKNIFLKSVSSFKAHIFFFRPSYYSQQLFLLQKLFDIG